MRFSKNPFFAFIIDSISFSEGAQLIPEVAESQFLLIAFISKQAFSHLFVSHLHLLIQSTGKTFPSAVDTCYRLVLT